MRRWFLAAACTAAVIFAIRFTTAGSNGEDNTFAWQHAAASGDWVRVRNPNGDVSIDRAPANELQITAVKRWKNARPEDVKVLVNQRTGSIEVCAVSASATRCGASIQSSSGFSRKVMSMFRKSRGNVRIDFTIHAPAGMRIDAKSVNGEISIQNASGEVVANTINGEVRASGTGGPYTLKSVNGDITADVDSLSGTEDVSLSTINGSVRATLPATLDANLDLETVNGRFDTDYPVSTQGKISPRHLRGLIGAGGRDIKVRTVNGSIELRRKG